MNAFKLSYLSFNQEKYFDEVHQHFPYFSPTWLWVWVVVEAYRWPNQTRPRQIFDEPERQGDLPGCMQGLLSSTLASDHFVQKLHKLL